ncbi:MAG: hypothetical protein HY717_23910 [Planctomycetes bacterium]|nr:hypothetical protein [Planctomycetota bacterium]
MKSSVLPTASMRASTLGVLELGTNSLKLHLYSQELDRFEPFRLEWEVGFEVYSSGRFSEDTIDEVLDSVRGLLGRCGVSERGDLFGIATGVFQDAENTDILLDRLNGDLAIPVRVLNGAEEARLLIHGFQIHVSQRPAVVFDLGGGRLEMVFLGAGQSYLHETVPLGVIQVNHLASFGSGSWQEEVAVRWIREHLRNAKSVNVDEVHGTGGTVKAISQVAGTSHLDLDILKAVEEVTRRLGAPKFLSPRRQAIFLPGVIIVRHILEHVGARVLHHQRVDLGEVFMERLCSCYKALGGGLKRAFMDHELEIFT